MVGTSDPSDITCELALNISYFSLSNNKAGSEPSVEKQVMAAIFKIDTHTHTAFGSQLSISSMLPCSNTAAPAARDRIGPSEKFFIQLGLLCFLPELNQWPSSFPSFPTQNYVKSCHLEAKASYGIFFLAVEFEFWNQTSYFFKKMFLSGNNEVAPPFPSITNSVTDISSSKPWTEISTFHSHSWPQYIYIFRNNSYMQHLLWKIMNI